MILPILIGLAVLVVLVAFIVALRPAEFRYTRRATIAAPPRVVFEQVNDLRRFQLWNPWARIDPAATNTFAGPTSGPGAAFTWVGNREVGEGTMTVVETRPDALVRCRMDFKKPFAATHAAEFTFRPEGEGTVVSWSLSGRNTFFSKAFGLVVDCDKMCGDQFLKGLANLDELMRTAAK